MHELKSITLITENVEEFEVCKEDIQLFSISGVTDFLHWSSVFPEYLAKNKKCKELYIQLKPAANKKINDQSNGRTVFERLRMFDDINSIVIHCYNEEPERYWVEWKGIDEDNKYQSSEILSNGNLLIVCSPSETAKKLKQKYEKPIKIYHGE